MESVNGSEVEIDQLQRFVAMSDMFRLLSLALRFPADEIAAGLLNGSLLEDLTHILEELGLEDARIEDVKAMLSGVQGDMSEQAEFLAALRREYTYLFNHPEAPAVEIYESQFLYRVNRMGPERPVHFVNPAALDAERCYEQAGLVMSADLKEPADNMATEMEFMMLLFESKIEALRKGDWDESGWLDRQIEEFSRIHLQKWAIQFFDRVASCSTGNTYRSLGLLGTIFISHVLQSIQSLQSDGGSLNDVAWTGNAHMKDAVG